MSKNSAVRKIQALKHIVFFAFIGYFIVHPLIMVIGRGMHHNHISRDTLIKTMVHESCSLDMLPWGLAFATFSTLMGLFYFKQKQLTLVLKQNQIELERTVDERTLKLRENNKLLEKNILERKAAEKKLKNKLKELQEFYNMAVGRELKMIEL
jgi:C4-dicarboxylate-specific signal transduction histidine kinase